MRLFQLEDKDRAYAFRDENGELFTFSNEEHMRNTIEDGTHEVVELKVVAVCTGRSDDEPTYDEERARVSRLGEDELHAELVDADGTVTELAVLNEIEARRLDEEERS